MSAMDRPPLLEVKGLVKRYGGLVANDRIDMQLRAGTITGVIGPNGAGKSTLIGLIGGAVVPSEGSIRLDGRDVSRLPASERARAGVGRTYQIPRPFLDMSVEENLEVAQYSIAPFIRATVAREERRALLARTGLADVATLTGRALPLLRRKRLEIARALALKPRVVLLDEVGAGLVDSEITELIELIHSILDARTAILIVEHVIRVVRECCSRTMVLNFGKTLIEGPTADILGNDQVAAVYLGTGGARESQTADGTAPAADSAIHVSAPEAEAQVLAPLTAPASAEAATAPALQFSGISAGYGQARVLQGIDLTVERGQAIAILGANGAGKTTLARTISGVITPTAGALLIDGQDVSGWQPHQIAALGIAHCMEGRRIFPTLSVQENLLIAARGADALTARERLEAVYDLFPILAERKTQGGTSMSGGQQQMLAIGRALMARPRLVIFDEISLGLAPIVMDKLYDALALLKKARMTLIVIEQDVDRALALADHAYVLEHGMFALSGPPRQIAADPRLRHIYIGGAEDASMGELTSIG
ncbi:ATP-binding cassette domain-containing protein [Bradyrhizobium sp. 1]|uniref:ATP-binding cassette domain-containing protein n=1 Tax=Bradyrhizobium sp. 1 TaxID=241591 RepID=UPI001FFBA2D5|nr:ATP-binding cassette domain-containing protein [Bradyrhizobium sp. 1]MCK1394361.1 ATP-binding cassette domain-containing protein [Bradyrhizobium sp. 1]